MHEGTTDIKNGSVSNRLIMFMHIPKTAGSTVRGVIERAYGPSGAALFSPMRELFDRSDDSYPKLWDDLQARCRSDPELKIVYGHLLFGTHEVTTRDNAYISIMRDPVCRMLSNYYYRAQHGHCTAPLITLEDYISGRSLRRAMRLEADNLQTRFLSGRHGRPQEVEFGGCTREMLEEAKQNIANKFLLIGLTEHFEEMMKCLGKMFDWKTAPISGRQRVTQPYAGPADTAAEIVARIEDRNALDRELYEFVRARFWPAIKADRPSGSANFP